MQRNKLRPPAVPLIVNDPYLSIWSMADTLTDQPTKHWTGKVQALSGLIAIDGQAYRFMGSKPNHFELNVPNMEQIDLQVLPTRTIYTFEAAGVRLELTFLTPLLPHNLELMSRPVSYLDFSLSSTDQQSHKVQLYLDISPALCVDHPMQEVVWGRHRIAGQEVLWMGSKDQAMLKRSGDDLRIEWGYLYATPLETAGTSSVFASSLAAQTHFAKTGDLLDQDDTDMPKQPGNRPGAPVAAWLIEVGNVSETPQAKAFLLAYDDYYSIEYFQRKLKPYWRKDGANAASLIRLAINDYKDIKETCEAYDEELTQDLKTAGGNVYVSLGSLAFRQCIAAHKLVVDGDGEALFFSKENYSNGCMGTVDITYPSSPFFLLFNPDLLKAQVTPILDYVRSGRWPFPFAPHDIGRYPIANGQFYGGGENSEIDQMPVEECGNMLILVAALYKAKSDQSFLERYWQILSNWADYLLAKGLDPENQLCTDDFAGHMAHNVNLSLKALLGIAAYAQLCDAIGETQKAQEIRAQVQHMTKQWQDMANDGDHYRLAFDKANTWSQKYNLVWDKLLGLELFPDELAQKELAHYQTRQAKYGLPLDSRSSYTKLDWIVWSASLSQNEDVFRAFLEPLQNWLNESQSRVPLTDWYDTESGLQSGFQARAVVGGLFIKLLYDSKIWEKWKSR